MYSVPQELLNEVINNVPRQDMPASSLVARRWRRPSQQRNFEFVLFLSDDVIFWEANIPQNPNGIPSYVRHVRFKHFPPRLEPGILSRVLKTFTLMASLDIDNTHLPPPEELVVPVSLGEFGKGITRLTLVFVTQPPAKIRSLIFSLPNLKELIIHNVVFDGSLPVVSDTAQRGPLELFVVLGNQLELYTGLAQWELASCKLSVDPSSNGIELLIKISSGMMEALTLIGV